MSGDRGGWLLLVPGRGGDTRVPPRGLSAVPSVHTDGPKDTAVEDALDKTYLPSLKTFEEEIMDAMGIVETRRAKKSYWY